MKNITAFIVAAISRRVDLVIGEKPTIAVCFVLVKKKQVFGLKSEKKIYDVMPMNTRVARHD